MIDIEKALEAVEKLRRVEPTSELERAVVDSFINSHLIAIHTQEHQKCINVIMGYEAEMYHNCLDELNQKLGKM